MRFPLKPEDFPNEETTFAAVREFLASRGGCAFCGREAICSIACIRVCGRADCDVTYQPIDEVTTVLVFCQMIRERRARLEA